MPKTKRLMSDAGIHAKNWHIHVPICSPSRSTLLAGRYYHNIKQVGGPGGGMHVNYSKVNNDTFVKRLHAAGYMTGMFGKYLNVMPQTVPPGFDAWFANSGGDYFAPRFMVKGIAGLPEGWVKFSNSPANYSTSVIGNMSLAFIEKAIHANRSFMAYIAPKAAHEPFNPAPWYRDVWNASWPEHEPRAATWQIRMARFQQQRVQQPICPFAFLQPMHRSQNWNAVSLLVRPMYMHPIYMRCISRELSLDSFLTRRGSLSATLLRCMMCGSPEENWNCSAAIRRGHHGNIATEPLLSSEAARAKIFARNALS